MGVLLMVPPPQWNTSSARSDSSASSSKHKRLLEEAINFRLSGAPINPLSFRRFSGGACSGFAGKLTRANIMGFWGVGIDQLGIRGKQIHETTQKIKYGSKFLVPAEVEAYEVHLVSYSGQGKYDRSTRCVPWHAIPDGNTDGSDDKSSTDGNMPDLPAGHMWWPTVRLRTSGAPDSDPWGIFVCYIQWGYSIVGVPVVDPRRAWEDFRKKPARGAPPLGVRWDGSPRKGKPRRGSQQARAEAHPSQRRKRIATQASTQGEPRAGMLEPCACDRNAIQTLGARCMHAGRANDTLQAP
jgi:hypothetical protein